MKERYNLGNCLTIEWLQRSYKKYGMAHVATDGAYVQVVTEEIKKDPQDCNPKGQ